MSQQEFALWANKVFSHTSGEPSLVEHPRNSWNKASSHIYFGYKTDAKKVGREFQLSKEDFLTLTGMPCYYCGAVPSRAYEYRGDSIMFNGLDRYDNDIGYVKSNCVPSCTTCNMAKHTMSPKCFLEWVAKVHAHWAGSLATMLNLDPSGVLAGLVAADH